MVDEIIRRPRHPTFGEADLRRGISLAGPAEQMFFFDAPLAHVVAHEEWQRDERLRRTYRRQARMARHAQPELPPLPAGERA